jgi:hypothetical protein
VTTLIKSKRDEVTRLNIDAMQGQVEGVDFIFNL